MPSSIKLARIPQGKGFFYAVNIEGNFRKLHSPIASFYTEYFQDKNFELGDIVKLPPVLLPPVEPTKIICVGLNYQAHAEEQGKSIPPEPLIFMKPTSSLIGHGGTVILPQQSELVHHEGELAIIIGRRATKISKNEVDQYIFGYTCANDVSARDIQRREQRYTRAKGFDTFCPLGPYVLDAQSFFPKEQHLQLSVNGTQRQFSPFSDFIFDIPTLVAFISQVMTLNPGDVILTGTPSGVDKMVHEDHICISISNLGILEHDVIKM